MKRNKYLCLLLLVASGVALVGCEDSEVASSGSTATSSSLSQSSETESSSETSESESTSSQTVSSSVSSESSQSSESESLSSDSVSSSSSSSSESSESSSSSSSSIDLTREITVSSPSGVEVDVVSRALPGEVVRVVLTYETTELRITAVTANEVECGMDGLNTYYFLMPESDVNLVVTAEAIDNSETYSISNPVQGIELIGVKDSYHVGEKVSFTIGVLPGYTFNGGLKVVEDKLEDPREVELTNTVDAAGQVTYEFLMPEYDVKVEALTSLGLYKVNWDSDYISYVYRIAPGETSGVSITDGYAFYQYTIEVRLRNDDYAKPTGVKIVETGQTFMLEEGETSVRFSMPHRNITLEAITTPYLRTVEVTNTDNLTVETYAKNEDGTFVEQSEFVYEEKVYVEVSGVTEDVGISSLIYSYTDSYTREYNLLDREMEEGYYVFEMPKADVVSLVVTEKDMSKFRGYDFVGDFLGLELWNGNTETEFASNYCFTIDSSGYFNFRGDDLQIDSVKNGVATLTDGSIFAYSDKVYLSTYNLSTTTVAGTDNAIAVKKQAGDDDSLYSVEATHFDSKSYMAAQFYRDGVPYAGAFINCDTGEYYLDVTFELNEGTTSILDEEEGDGYKVVVEGETVCSVGVIDGEQVVLDNVLGTYTSTDGGTLILDGIGGATLNDETGLTYAVNEDGTITVKKGAETWTITLDGTSFTITDHVESANELAGYTYSGAFYSTWDEWNYNFSVEFVDDTKCYVLISMGTTDYVGGDAARDDLENQTYTIDRTTDPTKLLITVSTFSFGNNYTIDFEISVDDLTEMTCTSDVSNVYTTSGAVLTREE